MFWTKEDLLQQKTKGSRKGLYEPIDSKRVFHLDRSCSGMTSPRPLLIHASCMEKIRYCSKCCDLQGTIFFVQEADAPPVGPRGNLYSFQRQPPMWSTTGRPGRSAEPEGTTRQSHMASGSSIPEISTYVYGANTPWPDLRATGDDFVAE